MKHLSAMNVIAETGTDEFSTTQFANAMTVPKYRDGVSYWFASEIPLSLYPILTG